MVPPELAKALFNSPEQPAGEYARSAVAKLPVFERQPEPEDPVAPGEPTGRGREAICELVQDPALDNPDIVTPVGTTCRACERASCEQRALPSVRVPLEVDEHTRGPSLYAFSPVRR